MYFKCVLAYSSKSSFAVLSNVLCFQTRNAGNYTASHLTTEKKLETVLTYLPSASDINQSALAKPLGTRIALLLFSSSNPPLFFEYLSL
jgi:hypothetical protein